MDYDQKISELYAERYTHEDVIDYLKTTLEEIAYHFSQTSIITRRQTLDNDLDVLAGELVEYTKELEAEVQRKKKYD